MLESKKKAREMGGGEMVEYHSAKQKGMGKWKSYLKSKNPDCYSLEGYLVVRLDTIKEEDATEYDDDEVIEDKAGHYYGVLCKL